MGRLRFAVTDMQVLLVIQSASLTSTQYALSIQPCATWGLRHNLILLTQTNIIHRDLPISLLAISILLRIKICFASLIVSVADMTDPLSITAGVVGVAAVGLQSTKLVSFEHCRSICMHQVMRFTIPCPEYARVEKNSDGLIEHYNPWIKSLAIFMN